MAALFDIISWVCLLSGSFFCISGGVGLLRFPNFFTRVHAAGVTDTLGAGLILLGLMFQAGDPITLIKLILVLLFAWLTGPTATHALAKSAMHGGVKPAPRIDSDNDRGETPSS